MWVMRVEGSRCYSCSVSGLQGCLELLARQEELGQQTTGETTVTQAEEMRQAASGTSGAEWERWVWGYGEKEG